jgi:hypothetical protein
MAGRGRDGVPERLPRREADDLGERGGYVVPQVENAWRPAYEIYDLETDPLETKNLWDDASPASVRTRLLLEQLRQWPASPRPTRSVSSGKEQRESLRALGHIR